MIGLGAPFWLLALAAAPLVYWLHRRSAPSESRKVSALFLWRAAPLAEERGRRRQPPDPAWRRRAVIAVLAALALAGPWWQAGRQPVTVWIDDSLSMRAVENGETRLAAGLRELRRALAASGVDGAVLRSLSDPAASRLASEAGALDAASWLRGDARTVRPAPPALLSPRSAHWLLTDGASAPLQRWAAAAPLARILAVGSESENVAVTRLAARRSAGDPRTFDLLLEVSNRGRRSATRELTIRSGAAVLERHTLALAAGETRRIASSHRPGGAVLAASLSPADALAGDDALSLDAAAFASAPALVDPFCPSALERAIATHPALRLAAQGEQAALQVSCSPGDPRAPALLRVHRSARPVAEFGRDAGSYGARNAFGAESGAVGARIAGEPAVWLPVVDGFGDARHFAALANVDLRAAWFAAVEHDLELAEFEPLLVAGERALIVRNKSEPSQVHVLVDMAQPEFVEQPEYAVFVSGLAEAALGRRLLDRVTVAARSPAESDIEPAAVAAAASVAPHRQSTRRYATDGLLALALSVLLLDLLLLFRRRMARDA